MSGIRIPFEELSKEALDGVIDEYITRESRVSDGTLETKRAEVRRQLERGEAAITYDDETGSTDVVPTRGA